MSILRQKLDPKPGLPENVMQQTHIWGELHLTLCMALSDLMLGQWIPDGVELNFGELNGFLKALPETALHFGYGSGGDSCHCLASFGPELAILVTGQSLGISNDVNMSNYKPTRLDLLLFKPVQIALETELQTLSSVLGNDITTEMSPCGQGLNIQDFNLPLVPETWAPITFYMKRNEDITADDQHKSGKAKGKAKADLKMARQSFQLLLPLSLLQRLVTAHIVEEAHPVIDPQDPWTHHMRSSIDGAIVPVRAVLETCRMTVADCTRFEIGQVIDLPGVSLQSINLETELGAGKTCFAPAALGIYKSHRAVKLTEDMDPDFVPDTGLVM